MRQYLKTFLVDVVVVVVDDVSVVVSIVVVDCCCCWYLMIIFGWLILVGCSCRWRAANVVQFIGYIYFGMYIYNMYIYMHIYMLLLDIYLKEAKKNKYQ